MDFHRLTKLLPLQSPNSTLPGNLTDLPPNILEALIPGYSILSRYALAYFGLDISLFVTIAAILLGLNKASHYLFRAAEDWFEYTCTSSVYIEEHDDLFVMLMEWLAAQKSQASRNRRMRAITQYGASAGEAYDDTAQDALDDTGLFNYAKWSARTPPRYEPYYGRQWIWHQGRPFWFRRQRRSTDGRMQVVFGRQQQDDQLQLDCVGRDIEPIKRLLREVRVWHSNQKRNMTTIRHPTPKERARFGGSWSRTQTRPSRPLDTVILSLQQKMMVVRDMNEFLHPNSPNWYATRGIPYRRGYLFHGPPGTGKTSLSFCLAGLFGLDVYAISLQDPDLTEGDLLQLFNHLPRRCIVLLEDVDAAGLVRDKDDDDDGTTKTKKEGGDSEKKDDKKNETKEGEPDSNTTDSTKKNKKGKDEPTKPGEEYTLKDLATEILAILKTSPSSSPASSSSKSPSSKRGGKKGPPANTDDATTATKGNTNNGISLSGLLNAIDGVASHEGRVLIMTTNMPDQLDQALIRPGRVDRKVKFELAKRDQIRELFVRMYAASEERNDQQVKLLGARIGGKVVQVVDVNAKKKENGHVKSGKEMNGHVKENGSVKTNGQLSPQKNAKAVERANTSWLTDQDEDELSTLTREKLESLAEEFAEKLPEDTLTPAEVQNLLMQYKKQPSEALARVEGWLKETLEEKERVRVKKEAKRKKEEEEEEEKEE